MKFKSLLNVNLWEVFITLIISIFLTRLFYHFAYPYVGYSSLTDFYVGESIYEDHNKYLDILILFVYLIIYFMVLPITCCVIRSLKKFYPPPFKKKLLIYKDFFKVFFKPIGNTNTSDNKLFSILTKYQYIFLAGFICLHPFNGIIYPKVILIIVILMIISAVDIYKRKKAGKVENYFSPFTITAILFSCLFFVYNSGVVIFDEHHMGEKFATFFMHDIFKLDYYKDIMLVHGYLDIIPSLFGKYIFDTNNISGYLLGEVLEKNLSFILIILMNAYVFGKNYIYIIPFFCITNPSASVIMALSFLILLKKEILKHKYLCLFLYLLFALIFSLIWTTTGIFWTIAALPLFFNLAYKIIKDSKLKYWYMGLILLFFALVLIIFSKTISGFLYQAAFYIKGNVYAFGNDFGWLPNLFILLINYVIKLFYLLIFPLVIIAIIKELKKEEKNLRIIFLLLFVIIITLISLPYTLNRIDRMDLVRTNYISEMVLLCFLPFFILLKNNENFPEKLKTVFNLVWIYTAVYILSSFPMKFLEVGENEYIVNSDLYNTGNIKVAKAQYIRLKGIKDVIYSKGENAVLYCLNNQGLIYLLMNKKIQVPYVSFYNVITSEQVQNLLDRLKKNPPDLILLPKPPIYIYDKIYPSIRVNSIYRWIMLDNNYKLEPYKFGTFLVKADKPVKYSLTDLMLLDICLANDNLYYLPDVWGKSIKTLPLKEIDINFNIYKNQNILKIKLDKPSKGKDLSFLYIDMNMEWDNSNYNIFINNSESIIKGKSKTGKILVPLDNFPSWLLDESIDEIYVGFIKEIPDDVRVKVNFYKKNMSD